MIIEGVTEVACFIGYRGPESIVFSAEINLLKANCPHDIFYKCGSDEALVVRPNERGDLPIFLVPADLKEDEFLPDRTLRVRFIVRFHKGDDASLGQLPEQAWNCSIALMDDMDKLFASRNGTDVVLVADGVEHRAHSLILSARSPVFSRMLQGDMLESRTKRVEITDIDSGTLRQLLWFLYTGYMEIETLQNVQLLGQLMRAADKYEVSSLREECKDSLLQLLTPATALDVLTIAHSLGQDTLKNTVLGYAARKETLQTIVETEAFDKLDASLSKELLLFSSGFGKKRNREDGAMEFPIGTNWRKLSLVQLQRACDEHSLNAIGNKDALAMRLESCLKED